MVATAPKNPVGRPRKSITRDCLVQVYVEEAIKDALDALPSGERRGFLRDLLINALKKRGLLDASRLAE